MQLGVGRGPRVLLGDARAELEVRPHRLSEGLIVGQTRLVECLHVQGDETLPFVADLQHIDDVLKAKLARGSGPPNDSAVNQVR